MSQEHLNPIDLHIAVSDDTLYLFRSLAEDSAMTLDQWAQAAMFCGAGVFAAFSIGVLGREHAALVDLEAIAVVGTRYLNEVERRKA